MKIEYISPINLLNISKKLSNNDSYVICTSSKVKS